MEVVTKQKSTNKKQVNFSELNKIISKLLIAHCLLLIAYCSLLIAPKAWAATSNNENYNLEIQNIDTTPEKTTNIPKVLGTTTREGGLESLNQTYPLSFSVSPLLIDFGILSPGNPVKRVTNISVEAQATRYQIITYADHPLRTLNNEVIRDTTCDSGSCRETEGSIWSNNLTYGYGYRCDDLINQDCIDSIDHTYFRQLPDASHQEEPQTVMSGYLDNLASRSQLTFKLNAAGNQKPGSYNNTVNLIAVPNY